jgi:PEP-CTERM motif
MHTRFAAGAATLAVAMAWGVPTAQAQPYTAGDFTYQFDTAPVGGVGGGVPITSLLIPTVGGTAQVQVYLLQTGHTASPAFSSYGMNGLGVRLNYASPAGVVMVPDTFASHITARPAPTFNPNLNSSDYSIISRFGTGSGTNTSLSAAIGEGLINSNDPVPVPGDGNEDPTHNVLRMLIGTFTLQALASGTETVTAVSGPVGGGTNSITGPVPPVIGPRNDGTTGFLPASNGTNIAIDPLLSTTIPTLTVFAAPEPSTLALGGLAAAGLAAWRRRRRASAPVAA